MKDLTLWILFEKGEVLKVQSVGHSILTLARDNIEVKNKINEIMARVRLELKNSQSC
jgi:hypothetical protein